MQHVSVWTKRERIRNKVTGEYEEPDEKMMREVERLIGVQGDADDARRQMISNIAAWAIDHPGQHVDAVTVFPAMMKRIRDAIFGDRRPQVAALTRDVVLLVRDEGSGLDAARTKAAEGMIDRLSARHGYCRNCAADAASLLVRKRFHDLLT